MLQTHKVDTRVAAGDVPTQAIFVRHHDAAEAQGHYQAGEAPQHLRPRRKGRSYQRRRAADQAVQTAVETAEPAEKAVLRDELCPDTDYSVAVQGVLPRPTPHRIPHLSHLGIPQLDGFAETSNIKCEHCSKPFETTNQLQQHEEMNQFGCDECFLCYTSKFYADLHELEQHPDTFYVRDHIPSSTKQHFVRLQHERLH
jgi:hypothetical protein